MCSGPHKKQTEGALSAKQITTKGHWEIYISIYRNLSLEKKERQVVGYKTTEQQWDKKSETYSSD